MHAKLHKLSLPANSAARRLSINPRLMWAMCVKIIDLTMQHLDTLLRMNRLATGDLASERGIAALDLASRYVTTATRDLERAVRWFQELKEQHL